MPPNPASYSIEGMTSDKAWCPMTTPLKIPLLQDPEKFLAEHGDYAFIGYFLHHRAEHINLCRQPVTREDFDNVLRFGKWLANAAELLPEWAKRELIRSAEND